MNKKFPKPNLVTSKCLNFDNCRFNWAVINDDFLLKLREFVNFIPVCPEMAIWLGMPRMPLRLFRDENENIRLYQPWSDVDCTEKMNDFCKDFLSSQGEIDWFVIKNRSPSCGLRDVKVYNKKDSHVSERSWNWLFGQNIIDIFWNTPVEDEGRLKNFRIRESFLTKIFCLARFRNIKEENDISLLQKFQANNKYLFMSYSQDKLNVLGKIIASYDKTNLEEIYKDYYDELLSLFATPSNTWKIINVFSHVFGYFKNTCSSKEKEFFSETLEVYREGRIPTSSVVYMLKTWALRDGVEYVLDQSLLEPYPSELVELSQSGKILVL